MSRFKNKVALIIGGGVGMGRCIAESFSREGATVVVSELNDDLGKEAVDSINAQGGTAHGLRCDISQRTQVSTMIANAAALTGTIDILVLTAASANSGRIVEMSDEDYDELVQCNISSIFWIAKDAAPYLSAAEEGGRLIYISSSAANREFMPGMIPYAASKAYMNAFVRGMAVEFGPMNILVNTVEPGMIATDRMKATIPLDIANTMAQGFPVPRVGEPQDIANAVLFLASPEASYITGSSLMVDGGITLVPLQELMNN
jgi:3-oxoacyl-[acyl-carrier protein] reductase